MRMRKKKNLDERLERCAGIYMRPISDDLNFETACNSKEIINTAELFGNNNPVHLEIGCGKGKFVCESAVLNPDINYIAVERSCNIVVEACEQAIETGLKNVRFLDCNARYLLKYLQPESIERIYLNFSCPYPKKTYASHRLTHPEFLKIYKQLLCEGGEIHQKTDNRAFFEFSLEQFSQCGYTLKNISLDLHNSDFTGNIETEYEKKFSSLGQPIYRLEAFLK